MNLLPPAFRFNNVSSGINYKNVGYKLYQVAAKNLTNNNLDSYYMSKKIGDNIEITTYAYKNSIFDNVSGIVNIVTRLNISENPFLEDIKVYLDAGGYGQIPELYYSSTITPLGPYQRWQVIKSVDLLGNTNTLQERFDQLVGLNSLIPTPPIGFPYVNYVERRYGSSPNYIIASSYSQPYIATQDSNRLSKIYGTRAYPMSPRNLLWMDDKDLYFCTASFRDFNNGASLVSFLPVGDTRTRNSIHLNKLDESASIPPINSITGDAQVAKGIYIGNIFYCLPSDCTRRSSIDTASSEANQYDYHVASIYNIEDGLVLTACTTNAGSITTSGSVIFRAGPRNITVSLSKLIAPTITETILFENDDGSTSSRDFKNVSTLEFKSSFQILEDSDTIKTNNVWMTFSPDNKYFFFAYFKQPTGSNNLQDVTINIVRYKVNKIGNIITLNNRLNLYNSQVIINTSTQESNRIVGGFRCQIDPNTGNYVVGFLSTYYKIDSSDATNTTISRGLKVIKINIDSLNNVVVTEKTLRDLFQTTIPTNLFGNSNFSYAIYCLYSDFISDFYCYISEGYITLYLANTEKRLKDFVSINQDFTTLLPGLNLGLGKAQAGGQTIMIPAFTNSVGNYSVYRKGIVYILASKQKYNSIGMPISTDPYIIKINTKEKQYKIQKLIGRTLSNYIILADE